jgi:heat shock protein HtpX
VAGRSRPALEDKNDMSSLIKTTVLLAALCGLMIMIGGLAGGRAGLAIGFVIALVTSGVSYWFSDKIVLRMYHAQPVGPGHPLYQTTARLAQKADLPMPKVYVIPDRSPNAFATGRNPDHAAVAATEGLLQIMSQDELDGVIAHELAHVKHRDILISSVAAVVASTITFSAYMLQYTAFFGGNSRDDRGANPIALFGMAILAPIAAVLIQMAISRQREFGADRGGARIAGTPYGLANALRRLESASRQLPLDATPATAHMFIVSPLAGAGGLANLFRSHPPTEERVRALMELQAR